MKRLVIVLLLFLLILPLSGCLVLLRNVVAKNDAPKAVETPALAEDTPAPSAAAATRTPALEPEASGPMSEDDAPYPPSSYTREEALEYLEDRDAPDFTLETLEGNEVSLSDYRGKIVFVSFWQTWCPPCVEEMPLFEQLMEKNADVVVLAVNALPGEGKPIPAAEKEVRSFVAENGFTFPVLLDRDGSVFNHQTYRSKYIPANYVIDREGILRVRIEGGYSEASLAEVLDVMRGLDW